MKPSINTEALATNNQEISLDRVIMFPNLNLQMITCSICKNVVNDPVLYDLEKICCRKCFPGNLGKSPIHGPRISNVQTFLSIIQIKCRYYKNACPIVGKIEEILAHEKNCPRRIIENKCGEKIPAEDTKENSTEKLTESTICKNCNKSVLRNGLEKHMVECKKISQNQVQPMEIQFAENVRLCENCDAPLDLHDSSQKHTCILALSEKIKDIKENILIMHDHAMQLCLDKIEYLTAKATKFQLENEILQKKLQEKLQANHSKEKVFEIQSNPQSQSSELSLQPLAKNNKEKDSEVNSKSTNNNIQHKMKRILRAETNPARVTIMTCQKCGVIKAQEITLCEYCTKKCCEKCMNETKYLGRDICENCYKNKDKETRSSEDRKILEPPLPRKQMPIVENNFHNTLIPIATSAMSPIVPENNTPKIVVFYFISNLTNPSITLYDMKAKRERKHKVELNRYQIRISSVKVHDFIYITGSMKGQSIPLRDSEKINVGNFETFTQQPIAPMLFPRYCHTLVALCLDKINIKILCIGGYGEKLKNKKLKEYFSCEIYDINTDKWVSTAETNTTKVNTSACNFGNKFIYAFGSYDQSPKKATNLFKTGIERLNIEQPFDLWKWEIVPCANNEVISKKIFCNFVQINKNEIFILGRDRKYCTFDVNKAEFTPQKEIELPKKKTSFLTKHLETEFFRYENEVYLMDLKGHSFLIYSINDGTCKYTDIVKDK